ncbi:MAG: flavodoxin family protein [Oscillospiraceae bacterium]|nr:flavodoxin family protein [Oscillospiraceae bacterium]
MKVIGVNGSPRADGNTFLAITEFFDELHKEGIETECLHVGDGRVAGCIFCGGCVETGTCAIPDNNLKAMSEKLIQADGILLAAPVYFGTMPGQMKAFLDRFMFPCIQTGKMRHKVGASAAILRRTGGYTTIDDLNRFFFSSEMIAVGQTIIHGTFTGEVLQDPEGLSSLRRVARNMAWVLKMMDATKSDIAPPHYEKRPMTNFIR